MKMSNFTNLNLDFLARNFQGKAESITIPSLHKVNTNKLLRAMTKIPKSKFFEKFILWVLIKSPIDNVAIKNALP